MVRCCCVRGCKNRRNPNNSLSFFRFPINNADLLKQWRQVVPTNSYITKNTYICSEHFDNTSFKIVCGVRHLNKNAIPKFFNLGVSCHITNLQPKRSDIPIVVKDEPSFTPMVVEVDPSLIDMIVKSESSISMVLEDPGLSSASTVVESKKSPSVKKDKKDIAIQVSPQYLPPSKMEEELRLQIKRLQNKLRRRDNKIRDALHLLQKLKKKGMMHPRLKEVLIEKFSGLKLDIFRNEITCTSDNKFRRRYTPMLKEFALTLYFYYPKAYNFVRKTLNLPHEITLRKWVVEIKGKKKRRLANKCNILTHLI